ncbi:hypothetical protein [Streptomyces sp. NPDC000410]|uniref:hypothetical protein n=1 Tax=Streptomyces sp. NPDC000410 TaxID=3154254 RepID=UPI00332D0053
MAATADRTTASRHRTHRAYRRAQQAPGGVPDAVGVAVLALCAAWSLISAAGRDARPEGFLLAVLAVAAGYACGRIFGTLLPVAAAAVTALAALALAVASPHGTAGATTAAAPVGRTGMAAALLVLAAGAACGAAGGGACAAAGPGTRRRRHRVRARHDRGVRGSRRRTRVLVGSGPHAPPPAGAGGVRARHRTRDRGGPGR